MEKQVKTSKSQCVIMLIIIMLAIVIGFGGFYWYDKTRTNTQIMELEKAIRTLQSQLYHIEPENNQ